MALTTRFLKDDVPSVAAAAPAITVAEVITAPDETCELVLICGATPSSVTVVVPGNDEHGQPRPDLVTALGASTVTVIKVGRSYKDPATGNASITLTNVTTVTGFLVRR